MTDLYFEFAFYRDFIVPIILVGLLLIICAFIGIASLCDWIKDKKNNRRRK